VPGHKQRSSLHRVGVDGSPAVVLGFKYREGGSLGWCALDAGNGRGNRTIKVKRCVAREWAGVLSGVGGL
jgi:hypothetical protein